MAGIKSQPTIKEKEKKEHTQANYYFILACLHLSYIFLAEVENFGRLSTTACSRLVYHFDPTCSCHTAVPMQHCSHSNV